ncbi:MAG: anion permease [Lachnospiraceae bacterium]|nr:anion permease [Lachnospiraceae bacterium]
MKKIIEILKHEAVLFVSAVLALASAVFVKPDAYYYGYIDYRTLSILLALMITMAGLKRLMVFKQIGEKLVQKMGTARGIVLCLIVLCFFFSMVITNDVALITFVPFTIVTLTLAERKDLILITIVLETVAANLGSMLTPLGNPQNLYLYSLSGMSVAKFVMLMLPYSVVALVLLIVCGIMFAGKEEVEAKEKNIYERAAKDKRKIVMYAITFTISLLVVLRFLPYYIGLALVLALVLVFDAKVLKEVDYSLIFTFIFLFVFIGNIKRIPALSDTLSQVVNANEVWVSAALSQVISNVPAAILCSGFTNEIPKLIVGTNIGGLGTLIASMASLISFKQYAVLEESDNAKYLKVFTAVNVVFFIFMALVYVIL